MHVYIHTYIHTTMILQYKQRDLGVKNSSVSSLPYKCLLELHPQNICGNHWSGPSSMSLEFQH